MSRAALRVARGQRWLVTRVGNAIHLCCYCQLTQIGTDHNPMPSISPQPLPPGLQEGARGGSLAETIVPEESERSAGKMTHRWTWEDTWVVTLLFVRFTYFRCIVTRYVEICSRLIGLAHLRLNIPHSTPTARQLKACHWERNRHWVVNEKESQVISWNTSADGVKSPATGCNSQRRSKSSLCREEGRK